jgi:large subunit ribosomal protein L30
MEKLCVIRMRSVIRASGKAKRIVKALGLNRQYSCVIMDKSPSMEGALSVISNLITYGEINNDTLKVLLARRSFVSSSKKYAWEADKLDSFVSDFASGKRDVSELGIKRVFHLHPPRGGFERKGKKTPFSLNGGHGYRGEKINEMLLKML